MRIRAELDGAERGLIALHMPLSSIMHTNLPSPLFPRRTKPVAGDINGMEVYEAEKGELDRIVKKLKDALEKKTMSKKGWHEHMAEIARKYVEGRGI